MLTYILIAISIILFITLLIVLHRLSTIEKNSSVSTELVAWMKDLGNRVEKNSYQVDQKLSQNMAMFNDRLDNASKVMGDVHKSIGEFSEIGRSMKQLQEFLQSPKLRGNIGEQILKELLAQSLPADFYSLQYAFSSGEKVDAVVKTTQGLIPIDSKFPIENFRKLVEAQDDASRAGFKKDFERDVKKHIIDIARKYILVSEGTIDYALMYIPSEAVYYEIINNADLYDYAYSRRVLLVSPMSFYAYLKAILVSFEGQRIQKQAKEILSILQSMKKDYEKTDEALSVLTKHVTNAYNQAGNVSKTFGVLGQKIHSTSALSSQVTDEVTPEEKLID